MFKWNIYFRNSLLIFVTAAWVMTAQAQFSLPFSATHPGELLDNPAAFSLDTSRKIRYQIMTVQVGAGTSAGNLQMTEFSGPIVKIVREQLIPPKTAISGWGGADLRGPSVIFPLNNNLKISVLTRMRMMGNFNNLDGRLISEIGEYEKIAKTYPYTVNVPNMYTSLVGFSEFALGISKEFVINNNHRLGGGVNIKLLSASGHIGMQFNQLSGEIYQTAGFNDVVYLSNASGNVQTRTSGFLFEDFSAGRLLGGGRISTGIDFGLKYSLTQADGKRPVFEAGIAVTDIGNLKYTPRNLLSKEYKVSISSDERLYFNNHFDNAELSKTAEVYERYPEFFMEESSEMSDYGIALPSAIKLQLKAHLNENISLGADGSMNLSGKRSWDKLQNTQWVRLIPQWNKQHISLLAPVSFSTYRNFSLGFGLRYKGLIFGSNSLFSSLLTNTRTIDCYLGFSGTISRK